MVEGAVDAPERAALHEHRSAAGVLLSPREYDRILERQRFLESIAAGLADAENGRTLTTVELRERLRAWRSDHDDR